MARLCMRYATAGIYKGQYVTVARTSSDVDVVGGWAEVVCGGNTVCLYRLASLEHVSVTEQSLASAKNILTDVAHKLMKGKHLHIVTTGFDCSLRVHAAAVLCALPHAKRTDLLHAVVRQSGGSASCMLAAHNVRQFLLTE